MSRRRNDPALFEIIHDQGISKGSIDSSLGRRRPFGSRRAPTSAGSDQRGGAAGDESGGFAMGRIVRIPLGYVIVAVGVAVSLIVVAYGVGVGRGERSISSVRDRTGLEIQDPTWNTDELGLGDETAPPPFTAGMRDRDDGDAGANTGTRTSVSPSLAMDGDGPVTARYGRYQDTRIVGLNYIVIARLKPDEADRAADFLETHGIDVMVLPVNNPSLRILASRRGFAGYLTDPDALRLRNELTRLGRIWEQQYGGSTDFSQHYGEKFTG